MRYFPALTGIRGIASLWVFLYHAFQNQNIPLINQGHLGVDLFFILSGFIISHVHAAEFQHSIAWDTLKRFISLRASRIYPLHLLTLLCLAIFVIIDQGFTEKYQATAFSTFNFIGNIFLVHTWLTPFIPIDMRGPGWSWNGPAWSLSAEWLMYFLFPVIAFYLGRFRKTTPLLVVGLCSLILYAALEGLNIHIAGLPRALTEFIAGCTLYFAFNQRHEKLPHWNSVAWLALILAMLASAKKELTILAPFAFYAIIPALAFSEGRLNRLCSSRASVLLGEISLSLYLIHWPILQIQKQITPMDWQASPIMTSLYLAFLSSIIGTSFLTYKYFELPMRNTCRDWLKKRI